MTYVPILSAHASLSNALAEAYTLSGALVSCRPVRLPDIRNVGERIIHEGDDQQAGCAEPNKSPGFVPEAPKGHGNGHGQHQGDNGGWNCSEKQQNLIQRIVTENHLDKNEIETLANERFGKGVKALNKLEASGLIEELLEKTGQSKGNGRSRYQNRFQQRAA